MSVNLNMMFCACECLCSVYPLELRLEFCISGWNRMLQPYIESDTALSDYYYYYYYYYYIDDEEITIISLFSYLCLEFRKYKVEVPIKIDTIITMNRTDTATPTPTEILVD